MKRGHYGNYAPCHMYSNVGGGSMKQEDEWGEDTWRSRKMAGVCLGDGKNGGRILREEKNGGSTHLQPKAMPL